MSHGTFEMFFGQKPESWKIRPYSSVPGILPAMVAVFSPGIVVGIDDTAIHIISEGVLKGPAVG